MVSVSQMPAAASATTTPHPLPGRQYLIKIARKLCPLPRRSVSETGAQGWETSRLHLGIPDILISKQQQNGFYISDVLVSATKRHLR